MISPPSFSSASSPPLRETSSASGGNPQRPGADPGDAWDIAPLCPRHPLHRGGGSALPPLRPPLSAPRLLGLNSGHAEAHDGAPIIGRDREPVRRPDVLGVIEPTPAAAHPERVPRSPRRIIDRRLTIISVVVPVAAPFPNVSVQVVQAPRIGLFLANRMSPAARVAIKPGIVLKPGRVITECVACLTPCAAGVLPFRLGGQPISGASLVRHRITVNPVVLAETLFPTEDIAVLHGVEPRDRLDGVLRLIFEVN